MEAGIGIGGLSVGQDEVVQSSQFDLFSPVQIESAYKERHEQFYHPTTNTDSAGPFKFDIPADPEKFTDVQSLRLMGAMRIVKKAGGGTAATDYGVGDKVGVVNNWFQSLFQDIRVWVGDTQITDPAGNWYAYKSYFENLLSYTSAVKQGTMASRGFIPDTAGFFDKMDDTNAGWKKRMEIMGTSKWQYFCINLHSDITTLRKLLPPNLKLSLEIIRNPDKFTLMTEEVGTTPEIELKELKIKIVRFTASDTIKNFYNQKISRGLNPMIPIGRSLIKTYTVQAGTTSLRKFNLISGNQLPDQILIAIVKESAYRGTKNENPFWFKNYDIGEASLVVNGLHEPEQKYQMHVGDGDTENAYQDFLENIGIKTDDDHEIGINKEAYLKGNFILAWDRAKDKCNRYHRHRTGTGTIDVNITTRSQLTATVTVIVYATYSSDIMIEEGNKAVVAIF